MKKYSSNSISCKQHRQLAEGMRRNDTFFFLYGSLKLANLFLGVLTGTSNSWVAQCAWQERMGVEQAQKVQQIKGGKTGSYDKMFCCPRQWFKIRHGSYRDNEQPESYFTSGA